MVVIHSFLFTSQQYVRLRTEKKQQFFSFRRVDNVRGRGWKKKEKYKYNTVQIKTEVNGLFTLGLMKRDWSWRWRWRADAFPFAKAWFSIWVRGLFCSQYLWESVTDDEGNFDGMLNYDNQFLWSSHILAVNRESRENFEMSPRLIIILKYANWTGWSTDRD